MRITATDIEALPRPQSSRPSQLAATIGVARLAANVGRLTLDGRISGASALIDALHALASTDSLIIDVRHSRDLDPAAAALLCSSLFDTAFALHCERYIAPGTVPGATIPTAPPRYLGKPVMILVGPETGVVAGELARNLKRLRRATVIGESPRELFLSANIPAAAPIAERVAHLVALTSLQLCRASTTSPLALQAAIVGVRRELEQLRAQGHRQRAS
jgi:hypothetical protein